MTSRILLLAFLALGCVPATADAQALPTSALFERVNESVCTIAAVDQNDNLLRRGSGFILKDSGRLVTNAHVLAGFEKAEVKCGDRITDIVRVTNYDGEVDLVIAEIGEIDVEGLDLSSITEIDPGTQVYAFGSPYGLEGTITPGLTSAYREIEGRTYIQISTSISPGSSGGPITDGRGAVIGVAVAALEVAQNINFAIPAAAVRDLPDVDLQLSDLSSRGRESPAQVEFDALAPPAQAIASDAATFRGHAFGSQCGEIAIIEYEQRLLPTTKRGLTKFSRTYGGQLEIDVDLLGAQATAIFSCSERFGLFAGYYEISGHPDLYGRLESELNREYGAGVLNPISETEARELGCRFNYSLPGSRFYRPSERTTWDVDERLRVEMLICGGRSATTFVFFDDPVLADTVDQAEGPIRFGLPGAYR